MKIVNAYPYEKVAIGRQGEDRATQIRFAILDMITALGEGGVFEIIVTLPQNGGSYIAGTVDREQVENEGGATTNGNYLLWTIEAEDTQLYGEGLCEVVYTNDGRSKSQIYTTMVLESLGNEETPDVTIGMGWFDRAMSAKAQVDEALVTATQRISEAEAAVAAANDLLGNVQTNATAIASAAAGEATTAAESWAIGGTGTRTGEDTDNSKYYAEQSESAFGNILYALNGFRLELDTTDNSVDLVYDEERAVNTNG